MGLDFIVGCGESTGSCVLHVIIYQALLKNNKLFKLNRIPLSESVKNRPSSVNM